MSSAPHAGTYRPELDLLRLSAFLMVFVHHWLPHDSSVYGGVATAPLAPLVAGLVVALGRGVDLFFVLSAFLITELLRRELRETGAIHYRAFLTRRALRIWPLYFVFLALCARPIPGVHSQSLTLPHLVGLLTFTGNWVVAAIGYPASAAAVLWSVSVEEQFYLLWPALLRLREVATLVRACWIMIGVALVVRVVLVMNGVRDPGIWVNSLARLDLFAGGALLALRLNGTMPRFTTSRRVALCGVAVLGFALLGAVGTDDGWPSVWGYALSVVLCVSLMLAFLGVTLPTHGSVRALQYFGQISYGLYVFHGLALYIVGQRVSEYGILVQGAVGLAITAAAAMLSYRFLERPFLRLKQRFTYAASRASVRAA